MKIIQIIGALPKDEEKRSLYEAMIEVCNDFGEKVFSPIDTVEFKGSAEERYERAFEFVKNCDLLIGEQSEPSTGQGMEIREAANLGKPLIVVAKTGSNVSGLVKACPVLKEIIYYDSIDDLKEKLRNVLK